MRRRTAAEYVDLLSPILGGRPEVRFAWLFGSAARDAMCAESDIDVAVSLSPGADDWEFRLGAMRDMGGAAGTDDVHVVVLEDAPLPLRATLVREGRLLVDRDPRERMRFERTRLLRWWDEEPRARWTARMVVEQLITGGKPQPPVLAHRAGRLRKALDYLDGAAATATSPEVLRDDPTLQMAVERALQVVVEALLDMASALVATRGWDRPEAGSESFLVLARNGVLTDEEARDLGDWVRFRNLLVHEYAGIDLTRVHSILRTELGALRALAARVLEAVRPLVTDDAAQ